VFLLTLFGGFGARASGRGFAFLLCHVALGVSLVLLGFAFSDYVVATGDCSTHLFDLAFDPFDDAFDALFWSALVIAHESILPRVVVELSLDVRESLISQIPPIRIDQHHRPHCLPDIAANQTPAVQRASSARSALDHDNLKIIDYQPISSDVPGNSNRQPAAGVGGSRQESPELQVSRRRQFRLSYRFG
jgi:hypothetical protein